MEIFLARKVVPPTLRLVDQLGLLVLVGFDLRPDFSGFGPMSKGCVFCPHCEFMNGAVVVDIDQN